MARPPKKGLDYFPMDTKLDLKMQLLKAKYKLEGIGFIDLLYRLIYDEGYYIQLDEDKILMLSAEFGLTEERFREMLDFCISKDLFDKKLWKTEKVLTSNGIQKRYFHKTTRREMQQYKFRLSETDINDNENEVIEDNTPLKESKVKEKKVKERKEETRSEKVAGKPKDFIDWMLDLFCEKYKEAMGTDFEIISRGKERKSMARILNLYKEKNKESPKTSNETLEELGKYFAACCRVPDNWMKNNMSPSLIINKFNEINNLLKNGNGKSKRSSGSNGATSEEILNAVAKTFVDNTDSDK